MSDYCHDCDIYHSSTISKEPACCAWYLENVVIKDIPVTKCPLKSNRHG